MLVPSPFAVPASSLASPSTLPLCRRRWLHAALLAPLAGLLQTAAVRAATTPFQPALARPWQDGLDPRDYLVSEKLDGVRALWDGAVLRFRSGRPMPAPAWFLAGLPEVALDGELWLGRRQFDALSGHVRREVPVDAEWRALRYCLFDLPGAQGTFAERARRLAALVAASGTPWLQALPQERLADAEALRQRLDAVVAGGGEGLVLHRADAPWAPGRSDALRKLKPVPDEEGVVLAHLPGHGKYRGRMGALLLRAPDGQRFALGSGFPEALRADPPPVGTVVGYRYRDRTPSGLPRFASFLRVRLPE